VPETKQIFTAAATLPDISSVCSFYIMYCIVKNSGEDDCYNCCACFPSYFTKLSKVYNSVISSVGLL